MSFSIATPMNSKSASKVVVDCYSFLDIVFSHSGISDYTDGLYLSARDTYEVAQRQQLNYLLDEVGCREGSRLLDIGCGAGTLLRQARKRGAKAIGITVSPPQAVRCQAQGLDARVLNYRDALQVWRNDFDCIIANGSLEHFVQADDAVAGHGSCIYNDFFRICHELLDHSSPVRKLATTAIHIGPTLNIDPLNVVRSPFDFWWGSKEFHCSMLEKIMGGYYPDIGQLEACAQPYFKPSRVVDGTHDYHRTSEAWLNRALKTMFASTGTFRLWKDLLPYISAKPRHAILSLVGYLVAQSWHWQFRGKTPPMTLLRHTWYIE